MFSVKNHRLFHGEDLVPFVDTPNKGGDMREILYLVAHYTAGETLEGAVATLSNPTVKASAHLVIGKDGAVCQLVPFNKIAWHAGQSYWKNKVGLNQYSIGIEMVNSGPLTETSGGLRNWAGSKVDSPTIIARHKDQKVTKIWACYTDVQISVFCEIMLLLKEKYGLKELLGHDDIAPNRKQDPGPAFPMESLRQRFEGREAPEPEKPTPTRLNADATLYKMPSTTSTALLQLTAGQPVEVMGAFYGWVFVKIKGHEGWIDERLLTLNPTKNAS